MRAGLLLEIELAGGQGFFEGCIAWKGVFLLFSRQKSAPPDVSPPSDVSYFLRGRKEVTCDGESLKWGTL